ncbi:MAG TPA: NAD(P)-dependent oxidoreductase, partial [Microlunatus sp.]|nr:NAD(P)-dependent oxidoreductase [Microlunatus sp.]
MTGTFRVAVLNQVSSRGLDRLPADRFIVAAEVDRPDAILLRSADLHGSGVPDSVLAVGRAGAGVNNIPVAELSARGVPVFNTPGANANAVKELVLSGMLIAARNLDAALGFVDRLDPEDPELEARVEAGKKEFAGYELAGHTLGVIGLGKIGCLVADAAIKLGMKVIGYDPEITVEAANRRGVPVFNAPFSNTRSVAEMIIAEIIFLSRQLGDRSREVHEGKWRKVATGSTEVRGKTIGLVGYGHIGSQVGVL